MKHTLKMGPVTSLTINGKDYSDLLVCADITIHENPVKVSRPDTPYLNMFMQSEHEVSLHVAPDWIQHHFGFQGPLWWRNLVNWNISPVIKFLCRRTRRK